MKTDWYDSSREKVIADWQDLKFGMFIHFGLFSIAGGCWNGKRIEYGYSELIEYHGNIPQADYEALKDKFTIENFNAEEIVGLAKAAGMKYIVLVSKHLDGFCLFDTKTTDFNSMDSPCHRDIVREMSEACASAGLRFGFYYPWVGWHNPYAVPFSMHNSDVIPPRFMQYCIDQLTELLSNYGPICELWMDMGAPTLEQSQTVADLAHRLQPGIMINGRIWNDCHDFISMPDNRFPDCKINVPWELPATIFHDTWCYRSFEKRDDLPGKVNQISDELFNVVENGGNYLLNIGPMGDGSVVPYERDVLLNVGKTVRERGLCRKESVTISERVTNETSCFVLEHGMPNIRYTGHEYYTMHPIITGYSWDIDVEEEGKFGLSCKLELPLEHEQKLCVETNDRTFVFSLKAKLIRMGICAAVHLEKGVNHISIYTPGNPLERPQFPDLCASLEFSRQAT